jgi:hypothetical protein
MVGLLMMSGLIGLGCAGVIFTLDESNRESDSNIKTSYSKRFIILLVISLSLIVVGLGLKI